MKIIKFIKQKNNSYKIKLANSEEIILFDDLIIKHNLLITKEISELELEKLQKENTEKEAYYKAIKYSSNKIRTEKEIRNYLSKLYSNNIVNKTIKILKEENIINEDRYIKAYINDQINLTNHGPLKIVKNLEYLGFSKEKILPYLSQIDEEIFLQKIKKYIERKIKTNHKYSEKKLQEKIFIELNSLGYEKNTIMLSIQDYTFTSPDNLLEKEYLKIYSRLSLKYSGYELQNKIISKLINKGFNYDAVKHLIAEKFD